jgi:hypothetical protein
MKKPKVQTAIPGEHYYKHYMLALPERATLVARNLRLLNTTLAKLFSDENFVTLLRAESITIPIYLKPLFEEGTRRVYEIG